MGPSGGERRYKDGLSKITVGNVVRIAKDARIDHRLKNSREGAKF